MPTIAPPTRRLPRLRRARPRALSSKNSISDLFPFAFDGGADLNPLCFEVSRIPLQVRTPQCKRVLERMRGELCFEQGAIGGERGDTRLDLLELPPQPCQRITARCLFAACV